MKALFIETFYGGSHRYFADGWMRRSKHEFEKYSLPARFWKWRYSGASLHLAQELPDSASEKWNAVVIGGMCDIGHLKALRPDLPPIFLYLHENQWAYPLSDGEQRDYRYGVTDLVNVLSADTAVFNSAWNRNSFLEECRKLFRRLPDAVPRRALDAAAGKARVIHPGIDVKRILSVRPPSRNAGDEAPLVIWNHRHEHDKDPDTAFNALIRLARKGIPFRLAILGERFTRVPPALAEARKALAERIVADEYPPRDEYIYWLHRGSVVISTARHEFFGLAVAEAAAAGCWPLLPGRLAYPEVIPSEFHSLCLWTDLEDFEYRLENVLLMPESRRAEVTRPLSAAMGSLDWEVQTALLDDELERTAGDSG